MDYAVSTLGITFSYGIGEGDTKPSTFTLLNRVRSISETTVEQAVISADALEDTESHNVPGKTTVSDTKEIEVLETDKTIAEWLKVIADYKAMEPGQKMWFQTINPKLAKASFIVAAPPSILPDSAKGLDDVQVMTIPLVVEALKGRDTKITPSANTEVE